MNNKKLFGYNMNKFLIGLAVTPQNFNRIRSKYNNSFGIKLGNTPYNQNLFGSNNGTYFFKSPNTNIMNVVIKYLIYNETTSFITLADAMNLLGLYHVKYEDDYISSNYNYLVDSVNDILINNYTNKIFRESVNTNILLANEYAESLNTGINSELFYFMSTTTTDNGISLGVKNSINDIIDGQLSPQIAKLIQSVFLTYNPLYNVDGTETTKEQFNLNSDFSVGNGKTNSTTGHDAYILNSTSDRDLETTNSFNNNLKGSTYDINGVVTPGTENKTTISGSVTTKNSESTMNDSDYYDTTKTVQTFGKNGNTSDTYSTKEEGYNGEYSGSKTTTGRTDSENTNINISRVKQTNNISDSTKANTESPYSNVHVLIRKGNIGVTKSTDLIDSERKTAIYNVAQEVAQLIAHEIFEGVY